MVIGAIMIDGVPYINGKPAKKCEDDKCYVKTLNLKKGWIEWICPECGAHLGTSGICLNLCHLSTAASRRFNALLGEAAAIVKKKEWAEKKINTKPEIDSEKEKK